MKLPQNALEQQSAEKIDDHGESGSQMDVEGAYLPVYGNGIRKVWAIPLTERITGWFMQHRGCLITLDNIFERFNIDRPEDFVVILFIGKSDGRDKQGCEIQNIRFRNLRISPAGARAGI